jgi:hypothetical protein
MLYRGTCQLRSGGQELATHEIHHSVLRPHQVDDRLSMRQHLVIRHVDLDKVPSPLRPQALELFPSVASG